MNANKGGGCIGRALRVVAWNVVLAVAGLVALVGVYEAWFRLTRLTSPFVSQSLPMEFVPGVGRHFVPNAEVRSTNLMDYWTVSKTNSIGFLDREHPSHEAAAASCHIVFVGDSFVEAREVGVADKFHVRLEAMVEEFLPQLDVATTGYGKRSTGQVAQLPFYDKWIRRLFPKLVVLVFVSNDFRDNTPAEMEMRGYSLYKPPLPVAFKGDGGSIAVSTPSASWRAHRKPDRSARSMLRRLESRYRAACGRRPLCDRASHFFEGRGLGGIATIHRRRNVGQWEGGASSPGPEIVADWEYTAFAIDEWMRLTEGDGVPLAVLATNTMGGRGATLFDSLSRLAEDRNIPVIDQLAYIRRQGHRNSDSYWKHDPHWNPRGHKWAAEAMFEWLERNPSVCGK